MLRKALLVLSGNAAESFLLLARNLLIARFIPVEDFGIAATLLLSITIIEVVSALGLQQQIVQARDGEDPHLQAGLQGFQLLRGLASGVALFFLAGSIASFLKIPQVTWGYQVLAVVPIINALAHFDVYRLSRQMYFRPMLAVRVIPPAMGLIAVWPILTIFPDWRAMLLALVLQTLLQTIVSQLVAQRPYRLALKRAQMLRSLAFGWPILINGVLIFFVFNGDRVIIGRELGMVALGVFSMGVTLTLTPTLVIERSIGNLFLPRLSSIERIAPRGEVKFRQMAKLATETVFAIAATFLLAVILFGERLVHLVLGERYADLPSFLVILAVVQVLRVVKAAPSTIGLSLGLPGNATVANLVRVATLPLAWLAVAETSDLRWILWIALIGEAGGYVVAAALTSRTLPGWLQATVPAHFGLALFIGTSIIYWAAKPTASESLTGLGALMITFCIFILTLGTLRRRLWRSN